MFITAGPEMTQQQVAEFQRALNDLASSDWKHKTIILPAGSSVTPLRAVSCAYCKVMLVRDRERCWYCGAPA